MYLLKAISYLEDHWENDPQVLFLAILILNSLNSCSNSSTDKLKSEISSSLFKQVGKYKTFNYWFKNSTSYLKEPYPDDLDDTFCAWTSLYFNNINVVDNNVLLDLSKILLLSQQNISGPYFSWVVDYRDSSNSKWKDLDFVVNLNIARFLSSQKISSPGLNNFIEKRIASNNLSSIFYKGELPSLYFLSHFYNGSSKQIIKEKIAFYLNKNIDDFSIILLFISIIRFGFEDLLLKIDLKKILLMQKSDGSFPAFDFYKYKNKETNKDYYSSNLLSTALFIELLSLLEDIKLNNKDFYLKKSLLTLFKKRISFLNDCRSSKFLLERATLIVNSKQSNFALFFPQNFISSLKNKINMEKNFDLDLSLINLFAWISYTIYDHINDEEGDADKLPLANLSFQILIKEISRFPNFSNYLNKIIELFIIMEKNNLKELNCYRFKKLPWLKISKISSLDIEKFSYEKSIGQIFSIYFLLDSFSSSDKKIILDILKYLILVKQMNDDLHDCFEDLKNGQISGANYILLNIISKNKKRDLLLKEDMKELRMIYHKKIIPILSNKILFYIKKARNLLNKQSILKENNFFEDFFSNYEAIVKKGERERRNIINYLG